jgi:hypothetical protein
LVAVNAAWTDGKGVAALAETLHTSSAAASMLKSAEVIEVMAVTKEAKGSRMWLTLLAFWVLSVHGKVLLC